MCGAQILALCYLIQVFLDDVTFLNEIIPCKTK